MARDNGQGMFTMPFICEIADAKDLPTAKAKTLAAIEASTATNDNKDKARRMVNQAGSLTKLVLGLGNFNLAHQGMGAGRYQASGR